VSRNVDDRRPTAGQVRAGSVLSRRRHAADPSVVIRHLKSLVKDRGVLAFQEFDLAGATSEPRCPLYEIAVDRIRQAFGRAGMGVRTG
jgi:hypothetical protein